MCRAMQCHCTLGGTGEHGLNWPSSCLCAVGCFAPLPASCWRWADMRFMSLQARARRGRHPPQSGNQLYHIQSRVPESLVTLTPASQPACVQRVFPQWMELGRHRAAVPLYRILCCVYVHHRGDQRPTSLSARENHTREPGCKSAERI